MKNLLTLLILVFAFTADAATYSSYTLTFTNSTANGYSNTINGTVSRYTNTPANATAWITSGSSNTSATNFFLFLGANYSGLVIGMPSSNIVTLGGIGLTFSITGPFGYATNSSLTVTNGKAIMWPGVSLYSSNRIGQASDIAFELVQSTNAIAPNAVALTNYAGLTNAGTLTRKAITSPWITGGTNASAVITNATIQNAVSIGGTLGTITGGSSTNQFGTNWPSLLVTNLVVSGKMYGTNGIFHTLTVTNLSSPGTGTSSEKLGAGSLASSNYAVAIGASSIASAVQTTAVGQGAEATASVASSFGQEALAYGIGAVAVGSTAAGTKFNSSAFGYAAQAIHSNSTAIGYSATTTETNQVMLGTSSEHVKISGELRDSKQTNVWNTGTNRFDLAVSFSATNITTVAAGVNLIDPGFKTFLKLSGPAAAYSLDKIQRGWDGRVLTIQKTDSYTLTINNESGSAGGAATDRILTGTGGTLTITNNPGFVELIYDATATRWGVKSKSN